MAVAAVLCVSVVQQSRHHYTGKGFTQAHSLLLCKEVKDVYICPWIAL